MKTTAKTRGESLNFKTGLIGITVLFIFAAYTPAYATVYLNLNAEDGTVGTYVPNPPFCQTPCTGGGERATYQSSGGTPQGSKYYQWQTVDNQANAYTEIFFPGGTITNIIGNTFYLAYFFRFDRINGLDIWHETGNSADKGIEILGSGVRWIISRGSWVCTTNQDHHYTVWLGNPSYNLNYSVNDCVENILGGNPNGTSIQLQYEHWYSAVMAIKIASDNTGFATFWIDGVKIREHNNIRTAANDSPTLVQLFAGGTIAQGAYDAPAHYRKFDALLLTDNWQDIIDGGYLSGSGGGDTQAPTVPDGLSAQAVSSSQINLSWTASTDNVGVTEYRIYRNNAQIATTTSNTSYSDTGLSSSTTYTYNVSAYDAAGNNSAQSSSASATTQAGGGSGGNNSNGDTTASGGSGCGFVKEDNSNTVSKSQSNKTADIGLMIMLIITLCLLPIARRLFKAFNRPVL